MEVYGVRVLAIVADRVFHLDLRGGRGATAALLVLLHLNNNKQTNTFSNITNTFLLHLSYILTLNLIYQCNFDLKLSQI